MTVNGRATCFVTAADGFLGRELVALLVDQGHQVGALAQSIEGAERLRRIGAIAIAGDLSEPGQWQDEAPADWVFHLAPRAERQSGPARWPRGFFDHPPVQADAHLLDAVAAGPTRRIIYVADASYYGRTGRRPITEDESPPPHSHHRLTPSLARLDGYVIAGLPIVTAFPGLVYGYGSWLRSLVVDRLMTGRRVLQLGNASCLVSPIHVHDCARALIHLAARGEVGGRYFVANNDAVRMPDFAATLATLANRPLRTWRLPAPITRGIAGPALADALRAHTVISNIRLRGLGFRFRYPTINDGLREVLGVLDE